MSTISRLYNFVNGVASNADQVDAEFDQIIAFLTNNVVHKDGTVAMTGALTLPANPTAALQAATKQYVDAMVSAPALPGVVCMYGGAAAPAGWLPCDGAAVSRTTYSALFTAIGTAHGAGDGSTTFNVPDLKGRVPVGIGQGAGLGGIWTVGLKYGSEQPQAHSHAVTTVGTQSFPLGKQGGDATIALPYGSVTNGTTISGTGGGANWQPSLGIVFIIKT